MTSDLVRFWMRWYTVGRAVKRDKRGMQMNRRGIALAGNLILDNYKEIDAYPAHSTLATIRTVNHETGGLVCNCAQGLSRIDAELPIAVIGRIGDDDAGRMIQARLSAYQNIDLSHLVVEKETSFTDAMIDLQHKTRTYFQFRGANDNLCAADFDLDSLKADFLHVGYILLLENLDAIDAEYGTVLARVLHRAQLKGMKTSIDVVSEHSNRFARIVPPALKYTDYALINEYEAAMTTGLPVRDETGVFQAEMAFAICEKLMEMGVSTWAVIHAREGAVGISSAGERIVCPSLALDSREIHSTIGAGDAFLSGCLYGAYREFSLARAMNLGIASASASLQQFNATDGILPFSELEVLYQNTPKEVWQGLPG